MYDADIVERIKDKVISDVSRLEGQVLTLVESAMPVGGQLSALKQMIKSMFSNAMAIISVDIDVEDDHR